MGEYIKPEDRDLSKLPKWAASHIKFLRHQVDYWRDRATDGPSEADTFLDEFGINNRQPLGKGVRVTFVLGERAWTDYLTVHVQDGRAVLHAGDSIRIVHSSSNRAYLEVV